jgi:hypothetical protein
MERRMTRFSCCETRGIAEGISVKGRKASSTTTNTPFLWASSMIPSVISAGKACPVGLLGIHKNRAEWEIITPDSLARSREKSWLFFGGRWVVCHP